MVVSQSRLLKESYFKGGNPKATGETITETVDNTSADVPNSMANYLKTLQTVVKK